MKILEKIYLYQSDRAGIDYEDEWGTVPCGEDSIEYIRTDAFIEKAVIWLNNTFTLHDEYGILSYSFDTEEEMFEDFKNYMKGE